MTKWRKAAFLRITLLHQIYDIEHRTLRISLGAVVMTPQDSAIFGIPIDFILVGLTLPRVAASNAGGAWSVPGNRQ
jgi:hypothetical protein